MRTSRRVSRAAPCGPAAASRAGGLSRIHRSCGTSLPWVARALKIPYVVRNDWQSRGLATGFPSPTLSEAVEAVTSADGLIAVTPVFSASYSGLFKSFFDVIDNDALPGKAVLAAATGGTARHSLALEHALRPLFAYLRAIVVPTAVYAASEDWGGSGDPLTDTLPNRIVRAAGELARLMRGRPGAAARPTDDTAVVPFAQQLDALRPSR
ncbi:CE1759 family FMN reductase [Streptomyces olivochromogenes]|uniref:CE1759 family FMN reductase n=1 Tax=Streptomyces olivochromogenes TaxID=1963 RepID=UPI0036ABB305